MSSFRMCGPGKFGTVVDELVYQASLDGCAAEFSLPDGEGWWGVVEGPVEPDAEATETEREWLKGAAFLVHENSQGFVDVTRYEDLARALEVLGEIESEFESESEEGGNDE